MNSTLSLSHEISSAAECSDCIAGMPRSVYYVYIAQTYMQSYVLPVICAFGLVANLGIIYVYARPAAGRECGRSTRLYYLVISIADEVNLLFQHTLISFLDFGLGYLTGGSFYWPIARTSDFTCKLWEYVWPWSEQVAGYTMVIFSLERFSAVWFPLKAKTWLSPRKAYLALGLMALAVSSVNAIPAVAAYVYVLPNQVYGTSCMARSDPVALNQVFTQTRTFTFNYQQEASFSELSFIQAFYFNISFLSMGVPTFCTLMLNVLISVGILQQASLRYALQHSKGSSSISNSTSSLNSSAGAHFIRIERVHRPVHLARFRT